MPMSLSMSSFLLKPHPPFPSQFQFHPHKPIHSLRIHNCTTKTHTQTIQFLKPYLFSQHKTILCGWLCSAVSVYSLSNLLSKFSKIGTVTTLDTLPLVALVVTRLIATYAQHALLWEASLNAVYELRLHVFDRVLQRELAYFEGNDSLSAGDIAYRITAEASDLADTFYTLLNTIVPSTLQLSAMMMQMLVISPALSLISAMIIPCMVLVVALLGQELRKISKEAHISIAALSAYLNEVLPAILFVKANNAESCENARFKRLAMMDYSAKLKKRKMKAVIPQDVGKAYNEWRQGEPAAERLFAMTRFKDKVVEKQDAVDLDRVTGELKFCDVSFGYNDDMRLILSGLNLHIRTGEIVAIVGPSGGGKTTLVKLLLRLYDPISGCILIDNHNIQNIRLASLRRHVGVVSQDITLFSGTVAENIGYRDLTTKIDMERVKLVAKTAHADEFIKKLPEGYKTNIGPRGSTLSGGQRQRLAIARAFYQNSSILILDEATSSLDSKSELLVRQAVEHLMQNRTVLVISHRLETVMMAKRVFLLDNGKLKELPRSTMLDGQKDSLLSSGLVI
ncbi:ABC transporter B family member 29, chloroplastic isoform X3 [Abrus precatorius]|uniref:ABC transporter B family member 29, chloroplastic isoform X3 n=1 Tax=Abrus precatorius TaxID=3816 RepID=A0A8B8M8N6_ABRPR|nr:ABC transporter B family member 29, chloroplastic isoform X3 [Abrus precatorius]